MALIMANEVACGTFTNGSIVRSDRFGVMMHSDNVGTLTIDKGSAFDCGQTVIQAKSAYPEIVVDGAKLASGTGVILQAMVNDDPIAGAMPGAPLPRDINAASATPRWQATSSTPTRPRRTSTCSSRTRR